MPNWNWTINFGIQLMRKSFTFKKKESKFCDIHMYMYIAPSNSGPLDCMSSALTTLQYYTANDIVPSTANMLDDVKLVLGLR